MKPLEKHIGYWLRLVSNQVSNQFAKELSIHDISVAEWVVLSLLEENSYSPAHVAEKIGMTRGAASKILEKLYQKKLILRAASKEDRRYQEISLSPAGKKILPKLKTIADCNDNRFFGFMEASKKSKMIELLQEIANQNNLNNIPTE